MSGRCALVVEDQPDSQELATFILGRCGMRVVSAVSVHDALQLLDQQPVDVVVSDIGLEGDRDGIDLIRLIRQRPEPFDRVPAIAVSAHTNSDDKTRALAAGYELHLAKPMEPMELIRAVAALLGRRSTGKEP